MSEDSSTTQENGSRISVVPLIIGLVILAIAAIGFLTSRASYSVEEVSHSISRLGEAMDTYFSEQGYAASISYDSIAVEGSLFDKKVVLSQPKVTLTPTAEHSPLIVTEVSSESVTIVPSNGHFSSFDVQFTEPVTVSHGESVTKIIPKDMVGFDAEWLLGEDSEEINYTMHYPENLNFIVEFYPYQGAPDKTSYLMSAGAGSKASGVLDVYEQAYFEEVSFRDVVIESDDNHAVKMASLDGVFEVAADDENKYRHYRFDAKDASFTGSYATLGAIKHVVAEIEDGRPADGESGPRNRTLSISNLEIKGEDFSIGGQANIEMVEAESLPFGEAEITIKGKEYLALRIRNTGEVNPMMIPVVLSALTKANTSEESDAVEVKMSREPGGSFLIGESTFEELAASMLKDIFSAQPIMPKPPIRVILKDPSSAKVIEKKAEEVPATDSEATETIEETVDDIVEEVKDAAEEAPAVTDEAPEKPAVEKAE